MANKAAKTIKTKIAKLAICKTKKVLKVKLLKKTNIVIEVAKEAVRVNHWKLIKQKFNFNLIYLIMHLSTGNRKGRILLRLKKYGKNKEMKKYKILFTQKKIAQYKLHKIQGYLLLLLK